MSLGGLSSVPSRNLPRTKKAGVRAGPAQLDNTEMVANEVPEDLDTDAAPAAN